MEAEKSVVPSWWVRKSNSSLFAWQWDILGQEKSIPLWGSDPSIRVCTEGCGPTASTQLLLSCTGTTACMLWSWLHTFLPIEHNPTRALQSFTCTHTWTNYSEHSASKTLSSLRMGAPLGGQWQHRRRTPGFCFPLIKIKGQARLSFLPSPLV